MCEFAFAAISSAAFTAETGRSLPASARAEFAAQFGSPGMSCLSRQLDLSYIFFKSRFRLLPAFLPTPGLTFALK